MDAPHYYREYAPCPELRSTVECFWSVEAPPAELQREPMVVLPDGCADLIFDLRSGRESAEAVGTMTRAFRPRPDGGPRHFGVRFAPGHAGRFLDAPLRELVDRTVELREAWSDEPGALADAVFSAPDHTARARVLERAILARARARPVADLRVQYALFRIRRDGFRVSLADLGRETGLTRQHLRRLFERETGLGPKPLSRILRVRELLRLARLGGSRVDWAGLAVEVGFADQAHLSREFRRVTGMTPRAWLAGAG